MRAEAIPVGCGPWVGDERALTHLYTELSPRLYRHAWRLIGDPVEAEELVAETFHRLLAALRHNAGPGRHTSGYLFAILHNLITDRYRRRPPVVISLDDDVPVDAGLEEGSDQRRREARARALLLGLTPDQRFVITLKYFEGLSNEEVAIALGKSVGTIKSLQHRGLEAMRRALMREGLGPEEVLA